MQIYFLLWNCNYIQFSFLVSSDEQTDLINSSSKSSSDKELVPQCNSVIPEYCRQSSAESVESHYSTFDHSSHTNSNGYGQQKCLAENKESSPTMSEPESVQNCVTISSVEDNSFTPDLDTVQSLPKDSTQESDLHTVSFFSEIDDETNKNLSVESSEMSRDRQPSPSPSQASSCSLAAPLSYLGATGGELKLKSHN